MNNSIFKGVSLFIFLFLQLSLFSQPFSLLKDINYGNPGLCLGTGRQPQNLTEANGLLFFTIANDSATTGLWKSDGTAGGSVRVKDLSVIEKISNVNGTLFISVNNTALVQKELWKSDGTEPGTVLVKSWATGILNDFTNVNGILYFTVFISAATELWKSDGTEPGTQMVKSLMNFYNPTNVNGTLFFSTSIGPPSGFCYGKRMELKQVP
jgi:ELWxxDGT repeat protein